MPVIITGCRIVAMYSIGLSGSAKTAPLKGVLKRTLGEQFLPSETKSAYSGALFDWMPD